MDNKKTYYIWRGQPLTKVEYMLLLHEIIADNLVEFDLEKKGCTEALQVINSIKGKLKNTK